MVFLLAGCSPTLNWRTVQLQGLSATLPCKPDQGERTVRLNGQDLAMQMKGCEAEGALFAISHVLVANSAQAPEVQQAWRTAALSNMKAVEPNNPASISQSAEPWNTQTISGAGLDGKPLQVALAWCVSGTHIYHLAVYAKKISPEMTEPFFSGAVLP